MSEWRDIETAPYGVDILVGQWTEEFGGTWLAVCDAARMRGESGADYWEDISCCFGGNDGRALTHWMPLRKPPLADKPRTIKQNTPEVPREVTIKVREDAIRPARRSSGK
jgi:hypothetical protein